MNELSATREATLAWAGGKPWPIALYMIALVVVTVVSVALAAETHRSAIEE